MSVEQPLNHQPGSFKHPDRITVCDYDSLDWEAQYTSFADAIDWYLNDRAGVQPGREKALVETTFEGLARNEVGLVTCTEPIKCFRTVGTEYSDCTVRTCLALLDGQWRSSSFYARISHESDATAIAEMIKSDGGFVRPDDPQSDGWCYFECE